MGIATIRFAWLLAITPCVMAQDDGYLGILSANEVLIDSVTFDADTRTGEVSASSIYRPVQLASWTLDGPEVVDHNGEVIGELSTFSASTRSLFNPTIEIQIPYMDRNESSTWSYRSDFSTDGPKIYDTFRFDPDLIDGTTTLKEFLK